MAYAVTDQSAATYLVLHRWYLNIRFTWRADKAEYNLRAHGISFKIAQHLFNDPYVTHLEDCEVDGEMRYHAIGFAKQHLTVVVVYIHLSDDAGEVIHLISERKAESVEEFVYADQF